MAASLKADFNGDGYVDLAIGTPAESVGDADDAGAVQVLFGSPRGLTVVGNQLFTQETPGLADAAEYRDYFGYSLASGDFNNDGFADLAIGAEGESAAPGLESSGAFHVLYGSRQGLKAFGSQFFTQANDGLNDPVEYADRYSTALAAADFDGDGHDDLAVGVPYEGISPAGSTGALHLLYGSRRGLATKRSTKIDQETPGMNGVPAGNDRFAIALVGGDFNGDGFADLAAGANGEDTNGMSSAGGLWVLYGGTGGLTATRNQYWTQDSYGVRDAAEIGDQFGLGVAAGDFNGDGKDDLAVSLPYESLGSILHAGAVQVFYGSAGGITFLANWVWTLDEPYVRGSAHAEDLFGRRSAAADFNDDGYDDLAIGAYMGWAHDVRAGTVSVIYGSRIGLLAKNNQLISEQDAPALRPSTAGDLFSRSVGAGDFNGDGTADLAVGIGGRDVSGQTDSGAVAVLFGSPAGIALRGAQLWTQDDPGIPDTAEPLEGFGFSVAPRF
jgi:hypothetical protein